MIGFLCLIWYCIFSRMFHVQAKKRLPFLNTNTFTESRCTEPLFEILFVILLNVLHKNKQKKQKKPKMYI